MSSRPAAKKKSGKKDDVGAAKEESKVAKSEDPVIESNEGDVTIFYSAAAVCLCGIILFFYNAPSLPEATCSSEGEVLSLGWMIKNSQNPRTYETAYKCASSYRQTNEHFLLIGFILTYVTLQSFAIPGPIVLSVLSGALYPFVWAHVLVACCATTGASMCFLLSKILGGGLIRFFKLEKGLVEFQKEVQKNKDHLFWYLVLSRTTPIPNILINLASPHVGVPLFTFASSTLFGLVPLNCVHIISGGAIAVSGTFEKGPLGLVLLGGSIATAGFVYKRHRAKKAAAASVDKKD